MDDCRVNSFFLHHFGSYYHRKGTIPSNDHKGQPLFFTGKCFGLSDRVTSSLGIAGVI